MNKGFLRRLIMTAAVAVIVVMSFSVAYADDDELYYHGDNAGADGDIISWEFTGNAESGTLIITGSGRMKDFGNSGVWGVQPWGWSISGVSRKLPITHIEIKNGITYIGRNAFAGFDQVTSVTMPDSVEEIGESAFDGCTYMRVLRYEDSNNEGFPLNLKTIGYKAFQNNKALTSVVLPDKVEKIQKYAFNSCSNLEHVELPLSLTSLSEGAFANTPKLENIVPKGYSTGNSISIPWGSGSEIPTNGIHFGDCKVKNIIFPEGITYIPSNLCEYMGELESIKLSDSIKKIESCAFKDCDSLVNVDFSKNTGLQTLSSELFYYCDALETVKLPDQVGLSEYPGSIFSECKALKSVHLPDSWDTIPDHLFNDCTSLKETGFNWPSALKKIDSLAFAGSGIKNLEIPSTVTTIAGGAFMNCVNLSTVHIPSSVTSMDIEVFSGCNALLTAGPSGTPLEYNIEYDWTTIPECAFHSAMITHVDFPDGITMIPESVFSHCSRLEVVMLPESVKRIADWAFSTCPKLKTVRLPKDIETVSYCAFENCSLKQLLFRGDAPKIDRCAFEGDRITCYYPGDNKTWTRDVLYANYEGKVTWKKYGRTLPEFASREREASLNYAGTVKARFYLVDTNGDVIPEARFSYKRRSPGKVEEFNNEYLVTDFDGGYDFQTPYLESSSDIQEVEFFDFELLSDENVELEKDITFTIRCDVTPVTYSEAWSLGIGKNMNIKASKVSAHSVKLSHSEGAKVKFDHKKDGTVDLTLYLTLSDSVKHALSASLPAVDEKYLSIDLFSGSADASIERASTFETKIENYSKDNASHEQTITTYLALVMLSHYTSLEVAKAQQFLGNTIDPFFTTVFSRALSNLTDLTFDQNGESLKAKISQSSAVLEMKNKAVEPFSETIKIGALSGDTSYSIEYDLDESEDTAKDTYKSSIKTQGTYSLLSGSLVDLVGVRGILGGTRISDASASCTSADVADDDQKVTISHCNYDSGIKDVVGWNDILQYHTFTAKGDTAKALIDSSKYLKNLQNGCGLLLADDYKKLAKEFQESNEPVTWKDTEKLANTYKLPLGFKVGDLLKFGIDLSASEEYSTEVQNGAYQDGKVFYIADSANAIQRALNHSSMTSLEDIFTAPGNMLGDIISDFIDDSEGTVNRIIEAGKAIVSTEGVTGHDWNIHVFKVKGGGGRSKANVPKSFSLMTLNADGEPDKNAAAATIGEPYQIICTDEEENIQDDLTAIAPTLTIAYSDDELEAAGYSEEKGAIGIYRMNEEKGGFEYVGGTVNSEEKTVTVQITKPGEYVLGYNESGLSISDFSCSFDQGIIKAKIDGFSNLASGKLIIDGNEKLTGNNFTKWYDSKTGVFEWDNWTFWDGNELGDHVIEFVVTDEEGHETRKEFEVSLKTVPEITEVTVPDFWYGQTITLKAKVTSQTSDEDRMRVWAEVVEDDDSDKTDTVDMYKEGDYWILKYKTDSAMSKYVFYVYASDENGVSSSFRKVSSRNVSGSETIDGIEYRINRANGKITVSDESMLEEVKELVIPSEVDGTTVLGIGSSYFRNNGTLEKITFPDTMEYIDAGTFNGCSSLKEVILNDGLQEIGDEAFLNCENLKHISVPSSVTTIGQYALGYVEDWYDDEMVVVDGFEIDAEEGSAASEYYKEMTGGGSGDDPDDPPVDPSTCDHEFFTWYKETPTCVEGGIEVHECEICGYSYEETVPPDPDSHFWYDYQIIEFPTREIPGLLRYYCVYDKSHTKDEVIFWSTPIIKAPKTLVYNGLEQEPDITVSTEYGWDLYTYQYYTEGPAAKNVGQYTWTVTTTSGIYGKGEFTFTIVPKGTSFGKITSKKKKTLLVKWKKQSAQADGYEIQYSLKKNFKGAKKVKITKAKTTSKTIKKLKSKKKYYFRIRTYKKAGGKTYYSSWKKSKAVKVK